MSRRFYNNQPSHKVYLVDLEQQLTGLLMTLADYCEDRDMFSAQELLISAMNFLNVEYSVNEAVEALEIELSTYCTSCRTPFNQQRIKNAVKAYIQVMHDEFHAWNLYGDDYQLKVTFVGWHDEYVPIFVPNEYAKFYDGAISAIVNSEPLYGRPFRIKTPYLCHEEMNFSLQYLW